MSGVKDKLTMEKVLNLLPLRFRTMDPLEWMSVRGWLLSGVLALGVLKLWRVCAVFKTFRKAGIPGPPPTLLIGNIGQLAKTGFLNSMKQYRQQYGKVFGMYLATSPVIVVSDMDLCREVMIKRFNDFVNRQPQRAGHSKPWCDTLLSLTDDRWKEVRGQLSPTFSSGKLKKMQPAIQRVVQNLVIFLREKAEKGEDVELKDLSGAFTMDVIAGAAFGMEVNSIHNREEAFVKHALAAMYPRGWVVMLYLVFPYLSPLFKFLGIEFINKTSVQFFVDITRAALKERRKENAEYSDFLQLLVESERQVDIREPVDDEINHAELFNTASRTHRGLTEDEMLSNALVFFLAGYDTVSTAMAFTLFCLANNPDCLHRAVEEIDSKLGKRTVDYESVNELSYLDMCLNETLRLYPPGFVTDRLASRDLELAGYHVTKGTRVMIAIHAIHTDPDVWPDPLTFDPERFAAHNTGTRHPFSFLPFGMGPRNCIGMRLARLEIKMALASLLQALRPTPGHKTVYPPRIVKMGRMTAEDELWVTFKPRV